MIEDLPYCLNESHHCKTLFTVIAITILLKPYSKKQKSENNPFFFFFFKNFIKILAGLFYICTAISSSLDEDREANCILS